MRGWRPFPYGEESHYTPCCDQAADQPRQDANVLNELIGILVLEGFTSQEQRQVENNCSRNDQGEDNNP